jgi:hypothetical protein
MNKKRPEIKAGMIVLLDSGEYGICLPRGGIDNSEELLVYDLNLGSLAFVNDNIVKIFHKRSDRSYNFYREDLKEDDLHIIWERPEPLKVGDFIMYTSSNFRLDIIEITKVDVENNYYENYTKLTMEQVETVKVWREDK